MSKLHLYPTEPIDELAWPDAPHNITLNSKALEILTDFRQVNPLIVESSITAVDALNLMLKTHVKMKLVVDDQSHFLGLVSVDNLNSQSLLQKQTQGYDRDQLSVLDFITPRDQLLAFDYNALCLATVLDVVEALKHNGKQHCLVIDHKHHKIRGVISASDIARKLHIPLDIQNESTFIGIFKAIHPVFS